MKSLILAAALTVISAGAAWSDGGPIEPIVVSPVEYQRLYDYLMDGPMTVRQALPLLQYLQAKQASAQAAAAEAAKQPANPKKEQSP